MRDFTHFCKNTSRRLGRELKQREVDFLLWVYEKHQNSDQQLKEDKQKYIQD